MDIPLVVDKPAGKVKDQICDGIRSLIISKRLAPGTPLPPIRILARQVGVNPLTVHRAYKELSDAGYLDTEVGLRTFVAERPPDGYLGTPATQAPRHVHAPLPESLRKTLNPNLLKSMQRVDRVLTKSPGSHIRFATGSGDIRLFPMNAWKRIYARHLEKASEATMFYAHPAGSPALREAIRTQILPMRGIQARPDEIMVTAGGTQGIALALDLILRKGDAVATEDPCWPMLHRLLIYRDVSHLPLPIDTQGADPAPLTRRRGRFPAKAVILTPIHQYPTTVSLAPARKAAFLDAVRGRAAWIIEDDYDNEFHYDSPPLAALKASDDAGQVIYVGTFSKSLFPALRLGFVVARREVIEPMAELQWMSNVNVPALAQEVLADFIRQGHHEQHIKRMRRAYALRRDALVQALRRHLSDFTFTVPAGGMRLWVKAPPDLDTDRLMADMLRRKIVIHSGSASGVARSANRFLHLGFGFLNEKEIEEGVRSMRDVVSRMRRK